METSQGLHFCILFAIGMLAPGGSILLLMMLNTFPAFAMARAFNPFAAAFHFITPV